MKIVVIGGGDLNLDDLDKPCNLNKINTEIVNLSNKKYPRLLYIGFNIRADYYFSYIKKIFSSKNCQCEYLRFTEFANEKTVNNKFNRADIIFLPGGNTLTYIKQMRKFGLDKALKNAVERNVVVAGLSAGAVMCFELGCSDSRVSNDNPKKYTKVKGFGFVKGMIAPHFSNSDRVYDIKRMLRSCKKGTVCIAVDEYAGIVIEDDIYKVITVNDDYNVFKCFYLNDEYRCEKISGTGKIAELYKLEN